MQQQPIHITDIACLSAWVDAYLDLAEWGDYDEDFAAIYREEEGACEMPLLANVIVSTARASFNAGTGITTAETAYLTGVQMHLEPEKELTWIAKSEGSLDSYYKGKVESGVDIATGDTLISIKQLDGVTDYPADGPATGSMNMVWKVIFHEEDAAALLPERFVRIVRVRGGGPH